MPSTALTSLAAKNKQEMGLLIAEAPKRIEQNGLPTALLWHPLLGSDFEDRLVSIAPEVLHNNLIPDMCFIFSFIAALLVRKLEKLISLLTNYFWTRFFLWQVTANNEFKFKQWNADNKSCRKTTLGPTFGGPITRLEQINYVHTDGRLRPSEFAAYGTADKVVGLVSWSRSPLVTGGAAR